MNMILLKILLLGVFLFLAIMFMYVYVQQSVVIQEMFDFEVDQYFVDWDSVYFDFYYGLKKLIYGNKCFVENKSIKLCQIDEDLCNNELGQKFFVMIIGCVDSCVFNEIIFDQGVGDFFIICIVGQVMVEVFYGIIEYVMVVLNICLIVVLGYEFCGVVKVVMQLLENFLGYVVMFINVIKFVFFYVKDNVIGEDDMLDIVVCKNVLEQVEFFWGLELVLSCKFVSGEVFIVGVVYNLYFGQVEFLEEMIKLLLKFV